MTANQYIAAITTDNGDMSTQLIPIFPLSLVLLPGMPLPLHIFEERYKEMMGDLLPGQGEFGVVLAKDEGIVSVGCTATVANVLRRHPDGRLDLVAAGQRRFQIESLDEEKSYLRAQVEFFDDLDVTDVPLDLRQKAIAALRQLLTKEDAAEAESKLEGVGRISFQIAQFISDLDKRQTLLALRSEVERLEFIVKVMPSYLAQREQTALAKRVGPLNGHPKHLSIT